MNDLPENQSQETVEEFSTVFSNPTEHKTTVIKNKNKGRIKVVIASLLSVAVLVGGTFAVVKLIPEKAEETPDGFDTISVLEFTSDDYKKVTVENENGEFVFNAKEVKSDSKDETEIEWSMQGYDTELTDSSSIESIISSAAAVSASREITSKTAKDCGLENPELKVNIVTTDDAKFSLLVGDTSPDNSGIYIKLSTDDKIYLTDEALNETFNFTALDMANTDSLAAVSVDDDDYLDGEGALASFDKLTVSGKNFPEKVVIEPIKDEALSAVLPYNVTAPTKRSAENVDSVFAVFKDGITVSGAYSFDVSSKTLKSLGLNEPDVVLTAKFGDFEYSYKFKLQDDGNYAVIGDDSKMVKMVTASTCAFLTYKTTDFYSSFVFLQSIDELSEMTIKTGGKSYSFSIKANEAEDAEDKYIIKSDGKEIDCSNFQSFYQFVISLSCTDFTVDKLSGDNELEIIYTYKDKSRDAASLTFKKASATKYQYYLDGEAMGKVNSSSFKKISTNLEKLLKGETVVVN